MGRREERKKGGMAREKEEKRKGRNESQKERRDKGSRQCDVLRWLLLTVLFFFCLCHVTVGRSTNATINRIDAYEPSYKTFVCDWGIQRQRSRRHTRTNEGVEEGGESSARASHFTSATTAVTYLSAHF